MKSKQYRPSRRSVISGLMIVCFLLALGLLSLPGLVYGILIINGVVIVGVIVYADWRSDVYRRPYMWSAPKKGLFVVAGVWPRLGMRYHGGRIQNSLVKQLLQDNKPIAVNLGHELIHELNVLYGIKHTQWDSQESGRFEEGSWIMVVHGDPRTMPEGRHSDFWVELVIIDYSPRLVRIAD